MRYLGVKNVTRNVELGQKVRVATTLKDRAVGLLATPALGQGEGLWLTPCTSIHTFFMRYPIDTLFIDAEGKVLKQKTYAPWRLSGWVCRSRGVLELPAGTIAQSKTQVGDRLEMKDLN